MFVPLPTCPDTDGTQIPKALTSLRGARVSPGTPPVCLQACVLHQSFQIDLAVILRDEMTDMQTEILTVEMENEDAMPEPTEVLNGKAGAGLQFCKILGTGKDTPGPQSNGRKARSLAVKS